MKVRYRDKALADQRLQPPCSPIRAPSVRAPLTRSIPLMPASEACALASVMRVCGVAGARQMMSPSGYRHGLLSVNPQKFVSDADLCSALCAHFGCVQVEDKQLAVEVFGAVKPHAVIGRVGWVRQRHREDAVEQCLRRSVQARTSQAVSWLLCRSREPIVWLLSSSCLALNRDARRQRRRSP